MPELASEFRRFPIVLGEGRVFPPKRGAKGERRRVEGSFETLLDLTKIADFRFHDLRHTFASWYMMNGGDLYELAKILGHSNITMAERYAKLARQHIARTGTRRARCGLCSGPLTEELGLGHDEPTRSDVSVLCPSIKLMKDSHDQVL